MKQLRIFILILLMLDLASCNNGEPSENPDSQAGASAPLITYSVVATYPHDTSIYTQGLEFYKGQLFESGGQYGSSRLLQTDLATGKIVQQKPLEKKFFGEGLTVFNDTIYQLTWQEHTVHVYSAKDFRKIKEIPFNTDGWGLTHDDKSTIATDGSSNLYFYDPSNFRLLRTQSVTENGNPAINLNELEYINGYIYANQYTYNYIVKIDPNSGQVVGKFDFTDLANRIKAKDPHADVLNGIAYNPDTKKVYITGKYWPELYEIKFAF